MNKIKDYAQEIAVMAETDTAQAVGRLKLFIYTSNAALPVEGAEVVIRTAADPTQGETLFRVRTNYDGEARTIALQTPTKDKSLSPYDQAYAVYYVSVTHPMYEGVSGISVQLYPDTITILPVNLQPKAEVN